MLGVRIKNLRSLDDTGIIKLKPLTLLLGANSSGKSSFLRFFPLLKQSIEVKTVGPILWYGRLVDFGSFKESKSTFSNNESIDVTFKFIVKRAFYNLLNRFYRYSYLQSVGPKNDFNLEFTVSISEGSKQLSTKISALEIIFFDHVVKIEITKDDKISALFANGENLTNQYQSIIIQQSGFIPQFFEANSAIPEENHPLYASKMAHGSCIKLICNNLKKYAHHKTTTESLMSLVFDTPTGGSHTVLNALQNARFGGDVLKSHVQRWNTNSTQFVKVKNLFVVFFSFQLFRLIDQFISMTANSVRYINPLRATAERYYRPQDLSVDEVDPQGRNLPMFLYNLSTSDKKRLAEWTSGYFGFSPNIYSSEGHISMKIKDSISGDDFNLADTGFGYSQILPILIQLWHSTHREKSAHMARGYQFIDNIFAIEQPELHLHPRIQSKLVDIFAYTIERAKETENQYSLLIETHSETIVNKVGRLIAENKIQSDDVNVILFDKDHHANKTNIRISEYDENGFLTNWPYGFFEPEN